MSLCYNNKRGDRIAKTDSITCSDFMRQCMFRSKYQRYNSFVDSILDNNGADTAEIPFAHHLEVTKESSGEYRYAITIDDPKVAMYHIQMMVVDKAAGGQYPFLGLFHDSQSGK